MYAIHGRTDLSVRSLFISDLHMGCQQANLAPVLKLLNCPPPKYLYLAGDFIDGWRLRRRWRWNRTESQVVRRLLELGRAGTKIRYTPGNHDEFFRGFMEDFGIFKVADEFVHLTANGQYVLVLHGDRFDRIEQKAKWLARIGCAFDDVIIRLNQWLTRGKQLLGMPASRLNVFVKQRVTRAFRSLQEFEEQAVHYTRTRGCDSVVCGHTHDPKIAQHGGITYCNSGDWTENHTAIIEHENGVLELICSSDVLPVVAEKPVPKMEPSEPTVCTP